jgi:hypothetical protein
VRSGFEAWNWYANIDINVTALVAAVQAINVFFSFSLVIFSLNSDSIRAKDEH